MKLSNEYFEASSYVTNDATETVKSKKTPTKEFLRNSLPNSEIKKYGISKPTRIVIRGRIAK